MSAVELRIVREESPRAISDAEELVDMIAGARAGHAGDERRFVERFSPVIRRILLHVLGAHPDLDDLSQEVLIRVFDRLDTLREPSAVRGFVASVAVFVAREAIRKKRRRKWLLFLPPEEVPEMELPGFEPEAKEALASFYGVVSRLSEDERIAFCLRYVDQMEILEIASATDTSMSTVKRRLKSAEVRFQALAKKHPELEVFLLEGTRWPTQPR